jgi:hypothetical protein
MYPDLESVLPRYRSLSLELLRLTTRVGSGPFPTELDGDGEKLRTIGGEIGVTTGRALVVIDLVMRRCSICALRGPR